MASGCVCSNCRTTGTIPSRTRLSPRYITKGSSPRNGRAISTAWASPSGSACGMYVIDAPNRLPSPTAASTSAPVSPVTMPISVTPAATTASMA